MSYFSNISWLRFQQETKWVSINFQRGDLTSAKKSHLSPDDFGETFAWNLIKQNATHFSFIFLTQNFCCAHEKIKFKFLLPSTVNFFTSYQRWLIRQRLLINASQKNFRQTIECLFFNEHSNLEERNDWIRLLNKLRWLKMQVMLTFFIITISNTCL